MRATLLWLPGVHLMAALAAAQLDTSALEGPLSEAPVIVRGRAGDSYIWSETGSPVYTYTRFQVTEALKGSPGSQFLVRQPGAGEEGTDLLPRDADSVLLLDPRDPADGSFPISGFPAGRYRVAATATGDAVLVNAMGVDAAFIPAKDLRPRSENVPLPMAEFRRLVHTEAPAAGPPTAATAPETVPAVPPGARPVRRPTLQTPRPRIAAPVPAPAPAADGEQKLPWAWLPGVLLAATALAVWRRARRKP